MRIPSPDIARLFFRNYIWLSLVFFCIYGGINYLTSLRSSHYTPQFDWESQIPFIPGFVHVYLSIFIVFLLPLFYFGERQIRAISATFLVATVFAGIVFIAFPTKLFFDRPPSVAGHEFVFTWLYRLELPHNLFPSLHVTYASLFIGTAIREEPVQFVKAGLVVWWLLLIVSIFLIRQHLLVDAIAGIALAYLCYRLVYLRIVSREYQ